MSETVYDNIRGFIERAALDVDAHTTVERLRHTSHDTAILVLHEIALAVRSLDVETTTDGRNLVSHDGVLLMLGERA